MCPSCHAKSLTWGLTAGGTAELGLLLLGFSAAFPNFAAVARQQGFAGWSAATQSQPCTWTGVACSPSASGLLSLSLRSFSPLRLNGERVDTPAGVACTSKAPWPHGDLARSMLLLLGITRVLQCTGVLAVLLMLSLPCCVRCNAQLGPTLDRHAVIPNQDDGPVSVLSCVSPTSVSPVA